MSGYINGTGDYLLYLSREAARGSLPDSRRRGELAELAGGISLPADGLGRILTEHSEGGLDMDEYASGADAGSEDTVGSEPWAAWLEAEGAFADSSDLDYISSFTSLPDDMMQLTIDAIRDKVVNASWRMVYAEDQATFDAEWDQMIADCEGLDAQSVIDWRLADIQNALSIRDSLQA